VGKTSIEWTDASWNPVVGCTEVSPGCANCYAARLAATRLKHVAEYIDLAEIKDGKPRWKGEVGFCPERLDEPLHWKKPRRIFVCDMGDLFHDEVHPEWILKVWGVMASCPQHTFQVLTKRSKRMQAWVSSWQGEVRKRGSSERLTAPLQNVWLGVSIENQHFADERIPALLSTPAAVRFISAEPLLGPVDFGEPIRQWCLAHQLEYRTTSLDWIIVGGESGPHARPMHPEWARNIRDWCQSRGDVCSPVKQTIPFFFKQWGEWKPVSSHEDRVEADLHKCTLSHGTESNWMMMKCGKKKSGRLLDGREWNEFPEVKP